MSTSDYWSRARQPLTCLVFLTPLLVFYEAGIFWLGGWQGDGLRNGADYWMRCALEQTGYIQSFLLPAIIVGGLLAWQVAGKHPWRVSPETLVGMTAESLLFACCLVVLGQLQDMAFRHYGSLTAALPLNALSAGALHRIVGFVGAGVYEEVLFRLCLLPVCYGALRLLLLPAKPAAVIAILCTSLLFSAVHYIGPAADHWSLFSFIFRALAGLFFAVLFVLRGFGVTAGCHVTYDLIVGVLLEMR